MKDGDYQGSADVFMRTVDKNIESDIVPQALYWAEDSFYKMGDQGMAEKLSKRGVQEYPKDKR